MGMMGEKEREDGEEEKGRGGERSTNSLEFSQTSSQKMHKKPAYHHPYYSSSMVDISHSLCIEMGNYSILEVVNFSLKPLNDLLRIT